MQIIIKGKQVEVTPRLRQIIERKVQRLARLVDDGTRVEVTVTETQTRSARDRYSVQIALAYAAHPVRSEVSAVNANMALDLVLDKVITQLGPGGAENAGKQVKSRHSITSEQNEAIWSRVLEIRHLPTKPMGDQEVIAQMETLGLPFFPFFNEATDSINVMYRLDKGGYGLLVPELE